MIVEVGIKNKQEPTCLYEYDFVVINRIKGKTCTFIMKHKECTFTVCVKYGVIGYMT